MTEETAMKKFLAIAALLVVSLAGANAIDCEDPQPFKGDWVTNAENQKQCVALVKEKCTGLRELSTDRWRRGKQVRTNCDSIPRWTAIGTFLDGDKFKGHSAIFESCAPDGIWVYDQWDAAPVDRRKVPYGDSRPYYNGDNYYMIEL
ncbi:domesticated amidase effector 2-like isoform X2 [Amblyomma americanum]